MELFRQDLAFAARLLRRDPIYTAGVVLTLALCLGANGAIFTVVRSILLRPLPYPDASRLVYIFDSFPGAGVERAGTSIPNYFDRAALTQSFDAVALYRARGMDAGDAGSVERLLVQQVTPSFFKVLGVGAMRGRVFTEEEGTEGKTSVAVLSYAYWTRLFKNSDEAIGRTILHVPRSGRPTLDLGGIHRGAAERRSAPQPESRQHRAARRQRDGGAGTVPD
jgi:hypothetical protein